MRIALLILLTVITGCGSSAKTPATVRGRVLFQGQPLAGGTVVFTPHPDRGPAGKPATATLDADGSFRLEAEGKPYIVAGWYRVALADPGTTRTWAIFPPSLRRPDRSGLEREVIAGQDNVFEFHIESQ
ncbi:hypothetical protein BH11PLA2_BH11PLA2_09120 [soil metagenome]